MSEVFTSRAPQPSVAELVALLIQYDDAYHNGESIVEDYKYDILKRMVEKLDPANPYLIKVGAAVRTGKEKLPLPMGSLDQLKNNDELLHWIAKYNLHNEDTVVSAKLDGYSCELVYNHGKLINAFSRGDGIEGASVLRHVKQIPSVPKTIATDSLLYIRGEIIMKVETFQEKYKEKFRNPRNMVAGAMNRTITEQSILEDLSFFAHEWMNNTQLRKRASIAYLEELGFLVPMSNVYRAVDLNHNFITFVIGEYKHHSAYELDGVVITIDDLQNVNEQSNSSSLNPEHSIKYKLDNVDTAIETEVVRVHWETSKNNLRKPRVEIKPVQLNGVTITFATGNNARFIVDNGIGKGAIVKIIRSGDVIPKIISVITRAEPELPTDNIEWEWNENKVEIVLKDKNSPEVVFKQVLDFFVSLEVDLLKEASLRLIFDTFQMDGNNYTNIIGTMLDLTEIEFEKIIGANGKKIYTSLHRRLQNLSMPVLMGSLNYCGVGFGIRKATALLEQISFEELNKLSIQDSVNAITALHGFDETTAEKIANGIPSTAKFLERFKDYLNFKQEDVKSEELSKLVVVMTGFRDKDLEAKIEKLGGKIGSSVSGKTTHLLAAGKSIAEGSGKLDKAKSLGIAVMTPEQFKDAFNL